MKYIRFYLLSSWYTIFFGTKVPFLVNPYQMCMTNETAQNWIQFQLSLINSMSWVKRNEFYRSKRTSIFAKIVFHIFHLSDTIYISKLILCVELVVCFAFLPADYLNWIFTSTQNRCANKQTYSSSILQINIALFLLNFESLLQTIHFNFNRFV